MFQVLQVQSQPSLPHNQQFKKRSFKAQIWSILKKELPKQTLSTHKKRPEKWLSIIFNPFYSIQIKIATIRGGSDHPSSLELGSIQEEDCAYLLKLYVSREQPNLENEDISRTAQNLHSLLEAMGICKITVISMLFCQT